MVAMPRKRNDILQGTLDMLILKTLSAEGTLHGYAITSHIQRVSAELLRVEEGSLYPALHRMEQDGWVRAKWGVTDKNREARFYSITAEGKRQLSREEEGWARLTAGVQLVLAQAQGTTRPRGSHGMA
jgi:PadR family transcriptional regulator, regulatory protein PadR